jgi:hypothetical protein
MSQLREFVRSTRPAITAWLGSSSSEHPFRAAEWIVGEDELGILVQAVLGLRPTASAPFELECLSIDKNGPWVHVVPDEATKRLAELPEASLSDAAAHVLDTEEADLLPQARSGPATRPSRVSWWRDELSRVCPFARNALAHGESLFLIVSL